MNEIIDINEYVKKVIEELKVLDEFFEVQIYGGEFNSDEQNDLKRRMSKTGKSNALVSFVEALETSLDHPNPRNETMTCVFVIYILNIADKGDNGYSSNAFIHGQEVLKLIKNNRFGFKIGKQPKILSLRNIGSEVKQNKEIAKMALVWTQDMVLASSNKLR